MENCTEVERKETVNAKTKKTKTKRSIILPPGLLDRLVEVQKFCSMQSYAIKPKLSDILEASCPDLKEADHKRIYKLLLTPEDKLNIEHKKFNETNKTNLSLTEFVCNKLKIH